MRMWRRWFVIVPAGCTGLVVLIAAVLLLALLLIKVLWAWTVPDLFPGGVEQGLVAESLSWYTAFKLSIFVAVLGGVAGAREGKRS